MQIVELLTPDYEAAWLPWAVQYFFFIGIAATTALTAAALAFGKPGSPSARLLPAAVVVLLVTAIAAPVSLLADLHQPGRFWHFYVHFTPWSWMSIGAYLLPLFVMLALGFCLLWWLRRERLLRLTGLAMALLAVSILVYTGAEVMVVRARPLWNTRLLPWNFAVTGWLAALGAMLLVGRWLPGGLGAMPMELLRRLGISALVLVVLGVLVWVATGSLGLDPSFPAALRLFEDFPVWRLSLLGAVLSGVLMLVMLARPAARLGGAGYSLLVALVMLGSAWVFRWVVFMSVQGVPKYGAGLYLYSMPLGGDGLLGILGMFGLCLALLVAVVFVLERFPSFNPARAGH